MQQINRLGYTIQLDDSYEGVREASYQVVDGPDTSLLDSDPVMVDCGSFADLERIASRALDIKLGKYASHPETVGTDSTPAEENGESSDSPSDTPPTEDEVPTEVDPFPPAEPEPAPVADWEEKPAPSDETTQSSEKD
ncbi:MAG TPA: hypothetical protein VK673_21825 [Chthoniobacterales bacterium]|nr:hypothetical protein [Chthoniobacterales bacterium]